MSASRRQMLGWIGLLVMAAAVLLLRLVIDRPPDGSLTLAWPEPAYAQFRYRAAAAGAIIGVGLAVSGTLLQALLRNPLASPFILGVSSGAGLGVMVQLTIISLAATGGVAMPLTDATVPAGSTAGPAVLGALLTLVVVYLLGQRRGWLDPISVLLIGVVVSTICAAGIMFCQHLVPMGVRGSFTTWLMGHVPEATATATLLWMGGFVLIGAAVGVALGPAMDAATLDDVEARSVGLSVGGVRTSLFALAGGLTAMTVALAGPIGFVGLIAPHAARLLLGPKHRPLVIGAALAGVVVVVGSDVARQAVDFGAGRMPIGVFTALVGGPAFIWLLRSGADRA